MADQWEYLVYTRSWDTRTKKWSYMTVEGMPSDIGLQDRFNYLGTQGWELVSDMSTGGAITGEYQIPTGFYSNSFTAIFKRRKP